MFPTAKGSRVRHFPWRKLNHSQDLQTKAVDLLLPNLSLNMTNIYPFQRKSGKTGPLDNFSFAYTMNAMNRISNNLGRIPPKAPKDSIAQFNMANLPVFFNNARKGMRHTIPTSFSFKALRHFTLSPSFSYEEKWYRERLNWEYHSDSTLLVKRDTLKGFNRISNYTVSASFTRGSMGSTILSDPHK